MMGAGTKRIIVGGMVAAGWLVAMQAMGSVTGGGEEKPIKAELITQVFTTLFLWNGQRRIEARQKTIAKIVSERPCILRQCEGDD